MTVYTLQATCNGRGVCGCDGTCQCDPPYSGTYCERCSGSNECMENCEINRVCAQCALSVIEPYAMTLTQEEFFNDGLLAREGIPRNSTFIQRDGTYQLILPPAETFCQEVMALENREERENRCPTIIIINGTSEVDYEIDGRQIGVESVLREFSAFNFARLVHIINAKGYL